MSVKRERFFRIAGAACVFGAVCLTFVVAASGQAEDADLRKIRLPPGFQISLYARAPGARSLAWGPSGTLFVGTRGEGNVYAVTSRGPGVAGEVVTIARNLSMPNGVAFRDGSLYVAEVSRVLRYDGIEARLKSPPAPAVVYDRLPRDARTVGSSSRSVRTGGSTFPWGRRATSASRRLPMPQSIG